MSQQTLTIGDVITVGTSTVKVTEIGTNKQGDGPRIPVVTVEVKDDE